MCLLAAEPTVFAQNTQRSIFVKKITDKITIDASLDEPIWQQADKADNYWQYFPLDSGRAINKTEVRLLYSDQAIYVGIKAYNKSKNVIVSTLRRDFFGLTSDNVSIVFDTYSDGINAFLFSSNPYGVQREVFISNGAVSREDFNSSWDVKWQSQGKVYDGYYILEMAIPFTSLKFKEGGQKWRFQTYRGDLQTNEQSAWNRVPQNQLLASLAFMGELTFEKPLGKSHTPVYIIPYVNGIAAKTYNGNKTENRIAVGGDAKIAVTNGLNLDVTVNPDFSNVEVDNVITNLTRFEVSLPEKRQFFIDNSDLFAGFGNYFNEAKPFFSRRIGLVTDTLGNTVENKILGGLRLSGKLDNKWRLGLLSIQTAEDPESKIVSNNNSMFAVQRKVFKRSSISAFMVNRQTLKDYAFQSPQNKYNSVIGAEYNLASANNAWNGKFYLHKSLQPGDNKGNLSAQAVLVHNTRYWNVVNDLTYVDKDFKSDLGFIPRRDIIKVGNGFGPNFYPKKNIVNRHSVRLFNVMIFRPKLNNAKADHFIQLYDEIWFKKQSQLRLQYSWNYVFLTSPFDPARKPGGTPLPANTSYTYNQFVATYSTNNSHKVSFTGNTTFGQFYSGSNFSIGGTANLRFMPKAVITLAANYDRIALPAPYSTANIVLISPKFDFTFTKSFFWSTLVQFSNQRKNLGINSRLQWRFAPLSDLFLVYNDNYYTGDFSPTYRSINLKFTYWLNL